MDYIHAKRTLIAAGVGALALGALLVAFVPTFWSVMSAQVLIGATSSLFGPAVCAISLGIVGHHLFDARFNAGFLFLAAIAAMAFSILYFFMPETRDKSFLNEHL